MNMQMNPVKDRDAALALSFLLLLIWYFTRLPWLIYACGCVLLLAMIYPPIIRPFSWLWFGLAFVLGKVTSSILLFLVWIFMVVPMGLFRRVLGKDSLMLRKWRKGDSTCFTTRDYTYSADDFKHLY